jgi:DNA-binding CsgD family transcriptional regulator
MTRRRSDAEALAAFAGGLSDAEDLAGFRSRLLLQLRRLVDCDLTSYNEIGSGQHEVYVLADPADTLLLPGLREAFASFLHQNPLIAHQRQATNTRTLLLSDFIAARELHRLELYDLVYRHIGVEHQLAFTLPSRGQVIGVTASRAKADFDERERALLDAAKEVVRAMHRNLHDRARLSALMRTLDTTDDGRVGVLLVHASGYLEPGHARAERLLEHLTVDPDAQAALDEWARAQRGSRRGDRDDELRIATAAGALRARYTHSAHEGLDAIALQLQPLREPRTLLRLGLTERQAEVLYLVWRGLGNERIARELTISPHTVRHHLEGIYERLGVSSRVAAAHIASGALAPP